MKDNKQLPTDTNKRAKSIVDSLTEDKTVEKTDEELIKLAAAALGRKGGLKGGKARANSLTPERRSEIAKIAAAKRWGNKIE